MRLRNRRALALLLSASIVFTMNSTAFAEEKDKTGAILENKEGSQTADNKHIEEHDGIYYLVDNDDDSNREPLTYITYETDKTDKKATDYNVATITNTTDPVSWNNFYARSLIYTVLEGSNNTDTYLNNTSPIHVSENELPEYDHPMGYRSAQTYFSYRVIPITKGQSYLFVGYGFNEDYPKSLHVAGYDGLVNSKMDHGIQEQDMPTIPVTEWDERNIEYNKSGKHKYTKTKKEILDVKASIVNYSNGVVTEVPGVKVGSVKLDRKALKAASVALNYTVVENKGIIAIPNDDEWVAKTRMEAYGNLGSNHATDIFVNEYAAMGKKMPSFTLSLKLKGDEAKKFKKDVKKILKDKEQTFFFGVQQRPVNVSSLWNIVFPFYDCISFTEDPNGVKTYTISSENLEKTLARQLLDEGYEGYIDVEETFFSSATFNISNFKEKEGKATIEVLGFVGEDDEDGTRNDKIEKIATLKPNKDYRFVDGSLAGSKVKVFELLDDRNYAYPPMDQEMVGKQVGEHEYKYTLSPVFYTEDTYLGSRSDLSKLGFKWAFRQSPVNSKKFRYGIYKDSDFGFVYSVN